LKPKEARANYRGVFDALIRISRAEGITTLWAGATPTVVRAMALNFGQLAFFAESKAQLQARTNLTAQNRTFAASAIAGFFASFFSLPFDFIKTRLQKQQRDPATGQLPYRGVLHCAKRVITEEGWLRFYRGFGTYYVRIAPHA
jgi:solute carrier family 25 oxoglutarate transporter 11